MDYTKIPYSSVHLEDADQVSVTASEFLNVSGAPRIVMMTAGEKIDLLSAMRDADLRNPPANSSLSRSIAYVIRVVYGKYHKSIYCEADGRPLFTDAGLIEVNHLRKCCVRILTISRFLE
jgi:hypothetical protein